jgi:predicted small metal-binding protein
MATSRKVIVCHLYPAGIPCEFAVSGDEEEIFKLAIQHAVESHGYRDTPSLRERLRSMLRVETLKKTA